MDTIRAAKSLPVRGAWIEMAKLCPFAPRSSSLPVRGAWIEINDAVDARVPAAGRSPCGERGLKYDADAGNRRCACRSPCGERGLKSINW